MRPRHVLFQPRGTSKATRGGGPIELRWLRIGLKKFWFLGEYLKPTYTPCFYPGWWLKKKNIRKPLEVTLFGLGIEFFMKRWVSATEWQKSAPAPYMHPASGSGTSLSGASNNQTRSSIIDALHIYIWINGYRDKWIKGEMDRLKAWFSILLWA